MTFVEDDDLLTPDEDLEYQPHRVDDPAIYGLADVARGRTPMVPTTVYQRAGDSASGVAGLLNGDPFQFLPIAPSRVGRVVVEPDDDRELYELTTTWDGAKPSAPFEVTLEDGSVELRQEHTKGVLLSGYQLNTQRQQAERGTTGSSETDLQGRRGLFLVTRSVLVDIDVMPQHGRSVLDEAA